MTIRRGHRRQRDRSTGSNCYNFFVLTDIYDLFFATYKDYDKDIFFQKLLNLVEK